MTNAKEIAEGEVADAFYKEDTGSASGTDTQGSGGKSSSEGDGASKESSETSTGESSTSPADKGKEQQTQDSKGKHKADTSGKGTNKGIKSSEGSAKKDSEKSGEKDGEQSSEGTDEGEEQKSESESEEIKLALPKDALIDTDTVDEIASFAKERGLSNADAQVVLEQTNKAVQKHVETQKQFFEEKQAALWFEEIKNHKELGGDKFAENAEIAKNFVKTLPPHIKKVLNETPWGNNPILFEICTLAGRELTSDTLVTGNTGGAGATKSFEDYFYEKKEEIV